MMSHALAQLLQYVKTYYARLQRLLTVLECCVDAQHNSPWTCVQDVPASTLQVTGVLGLAVCLVGYYHWRALLQNKHQEGASSSCAGAPTKQVRLMPQQPLRDQHHNNTGLCTRKCPCPSPPRCAPHHHQLAGHGLAGNQRSRPGRRRFRRGRQPCPASCSAAALSSVSPVPRRL